MGSKKSNSFLSFYLALLSFSLLQTSQASWNGQLNFKEDNTFTILQLTDLHFGEEQIKDIRTMGIQSSLIKSVKPDLIVLTGDMFTGYTDRCHGENPEPNCYQNGWIKYTTVLRTLKQKYAIILGNHDIEANLNSQQIIELDMKSDYSLTKQSPEGVSPGSNYYLPIYDKNGNSIETLLWMFDSHREDCSGQTRWGCVERDQIDWFNSEYRQILTQQKKEQIQGISFVHIPFPEYVDLVNDFEISGQMSEEICCPIVNTGLADALMNNDVISNYVGHDHDNDYGGVFKKNGRQIELHYGRKTGFGSYGPEGMNKGGTIINLRSLGDGRIQVDTIIQDEVGQTINRGQTYRRQQKAKMCHEI